MTRSTASDSASSRLVLVTGADTPTGLTTARALRGMGLRLWGITTRPAASCCTSNIWDSLFTVSGDADAQLDFIVTATEQEDQKPVLLFAQDDLVAAANDRRESLSERFLMPLPSQSATELMLDKTRFQRWAEAQGYLVPHAEVAESPAQLSSAIKEAPRPAIVKPLVRTPAWDSHMGSRKCLWIDDNGALEGGRWTPEQLFGLAPRFLVQSWVEGGDDDIYFYLTAISPSGKILDEVCGRKLMQWPPLTGSTAICHTIHNPEFCALSRDILMAAGLRGLGSIEFKRDPRDGRFYITEPTVGRNDHQSAVAVAGGHNPTAGLIANLLGLSPPKKSPPKSPSPLWIDELSVIRHCRSEHVWRHFFRLLFTGLSRGLPRPLLLEWGDAKPFWRIVSDIGRRKWHS